MINRIAIAAIAATAACSGALADTVDVRYVGTGQGRVIKYDFNGSRKNVFAGQLKHNFSNGTGVASQLSGDILTFCTDLTEYVSRSSRSFELVDPQFAPGDPMGLNRANALRDLFGFAGGQQLSRTVDRDYAAAFQLAVWEIVYDFNDAQGRSSLDIESGAFESYKRDGSQLSSAIRGHLGDLFDAIGTGAGRSNGMDLFAVVNDGSQDQLVEIPAVPLPPAGGLAFAGLLGAATMRRR